jgi:hypothetical protein
LGNSQQSARDRLEPYKCLVPQFKHMQLHVLKKKKKKLVKSEEEQG